LLLLVAAAEPVGDPLLLWRAAERLGIAAAAVDTDTDAALTFGDQVTFRHPLVRSAVYRSAPLQQRRAVHLALAEVTDRLSDDLQPEIIRRPVCRWMEVIPRWACWRYMTTSGMPSCAISIAFAWRSWCSANRRRTPAAAAVRRSCLRAADGSQCRPAVGP
jgi:hypothetical protein